MGTTYIHSITYYDDQKNIQTLTLTLDFKGFAHPVMVLVEGTIYCINTKDKGQQYRKRTTILDKEQQYWTKNSNTGQRTKIQDKGQHTYIVLHTMTTRRTYKH